jgi:uncharacterized damage-inducible protein DinB
MLSALKMLDWSDAVHAAWTERLRKTDPALLRANFEVSFNTPLGVLTHLANVENGYVDVVEGLPQNWRRHSTKEFTDLEPVLAYARETRSRTRAVLARLGEGALGKSFPVDFAANKAMTLEEILFTIVTHEQAHRGEILACFWQKDIEPPVVDYPRYGTPLS